MIGSAARFGFQSFLSNLRNGNIDSNYRDVSKNLSSTQIPFSLQKNLHVPMSDLGKIDRNLSDINQENTSTRIQTEHSEEKQVEMELLSFVMYKILKSSFSKSLNENNKTSESIFMTREVMANEIASLIAEAVWLKNDNIGLKKQYE